MSTHVLNQLDALQSKSALPATVFTQVQQFLTLCNHENIFPNDPKLVELGDSLVIEWIRARQIWSVDFDDEGATGIVYVPETAAQQEQVALCETTFAETLIEFFKTQHRALHM